MIRLSCNNFGVLPLLCLPLLSGCGRTDVYVGGLTDEAYIWKNGASYALNNYSGGGNVNGVTLAGGHVYAVGTYYRSAISPQAVLWIDGNGTFLMDGANATEPQSVAVSGTDVYVAGYSAPVGQPSLTTATWWHNGTPTHLTSTTLSIALQVVLSGSDVYAVGWDYLSGPKAYPVPVYWKNGAETVLSTTFGYGQSIAVSGNTVYVAICQIDSDPNVQSSAARIRSKPSDALNLVNDCGKTLTGGYQSTQAVLWTSGTPPSLLEEKESAPVSIAVVGSDVYVTGFVEPQPVVWKNGKETPLDSQTFPVYPSGPGGISVADGDVYIAATQFPATSPQGLAGYYKNSVFTPLGVPGSQSLTSGIAVAHN